MKISNGKMSAVVFAIAVMAFCLGYFIAIQPTDTELEVNSKAQLEIGQPVEKFELNLVPVGSIVKRESAKIQSGDHLALETAQARIISLEEEILVLRDSCSSLNQEVLISDGRISRLEKQLENALLDPSSSPFGSFLNSSVGAHTNALERLLILRVLQDVPIVLSDTESVWLLENFRVGEMQVDYQELVSLLGPRRVQNELSSGEFEELRNHLTADSWLSFFPGWTEPGSQGEHR